MKKNYEQPTIKVIDCEINTSILRGSNIDSGGDDGGDGVAESNEREDFSGVYGDLWIN